MIDFAFVASKLTELHGWHTRVFKQGVLTFQRSLHPPPFDPVSSDLSAILADERACFYYPSTEFVCYGLVRDSCQDIALVIGPVSEFRLEHAQCTRILTALGEPMEKLGSFIRYMNGTQPMRIDVLAQVLILLHYLVSGEVLPSLDPPLETGWAVERQVFREQMDFESAFPHDALPHDSFEYECEMMSFVSAGDSSGLKRFLGKNQYKGRFGKMSQDTMRSRKNLFVCYATVACRAAIRGGMDVEAALTLSDHYMQHMESLSDPKAIQGLRATMLADYCDRVALIRTGSSSTRLSRLVMHYLMKNIDVPVSTSDIANKLGVNRAQLCRHFKRATGMSIMQKANELRIGSAKRLLRHTDRSLADISEHLAFSSQSHFQNTFKRLTGLTPREYRNALHE